MLDGDAHRHGHSDSHVICNRHVDINVDVFIDAHLHELVVCDVHGDAPRDTARVDRRLVRCPWAPVRLRAGLLLLELRVLRHE